MILGMPWGVWLADRRHTREGMEAEAEAREEEEGEKEGRKGGGAHTIPLPRDLEPRVAETPGIVVDRLLRIHEHILLARAAGIQACDLADDFLALWGDREGGGGVGGVVHAGGGVVGGIGCWGGVHARLGGWGGPWWWGMGGGMLVWKGGGE